MSTKKKRPTRSRRPSPSVQHERPPGTVGAMDPERGVALLQRWRDEGDAEEDRRAHEAVREEVERARS